MKVLLTRKLKDSVAVIFSAKMWNRVPLVLLEANKRKIVAGVVPSNHPDVNEKLGDNEMMLTKKTLEVLKCDLNDIQIVFPKTNLFVYGTLLSRYINLNYYEIKNGWGGELHSIPYVRGIVSNYKLVWDVLPRAIPNSGEILGEVYLNVPDDTLEYINGIETSANYRAVELNVRVLENMVLQPRINAIMYEYRTKNDAKNLYTIRFPDAYVCDNEIIHHNYEQFFDILQGNVPIIISAPHGGYMRPIDLPRYYRKGTDEETYELSRKIIEYVYILTNKKYIPSFIGSLLHPSRCNPNIGEFNEYEKKYHELLRRIINNLQMNFDKIVLLDIHGMRADRNYQIELGTCYHKTIKDMSIFDIIHDTLSERYTVTSNNQFLGGYITRYYGKFDKVNAVQIEIRKDLRKLDIDETAKCLAKMIIKLIKYIR